MNTNGRLRVNTPRIVHETIDGETVLLNLDTGNYYSLAGVGAHIWGFIEGGAPLNDIIEKMKCDYDSNGTDVEGTINKFVSELLQERLIVPDKTETPASFQWPAEERASDSKTAKQTFRSPILNKYTDMQDLLLLDPIHDVDEEAGWPKPSTK